MSLIGLNSLNSDVLYNNNQRLQQIYNSNPRSGPQVLFTPKSQPKARLKLLRAGVLHCK